MAGFCWWRQVAGVDDEAGGTGRRPASSFWQRLSRATRRASADKSVAAAAAESSSTSRSRGNGSVRRPTATTMNHCSPTGSLPGTVVHGTHTEFTFHCRSRQWRTKAGCWVRTNPQSPPSRVPSLYKTPSVTLSWQNILLLSVRVRQLTEDHQLLAQNSFSGFSFLRHIHLH